MLPEWRIKFHNKIVIFWSCEERHPELWKDHNLITSTRELWLQMVETLIERRSLKLLHSKQKYDGSYYRRRSS